MRRLFLSICVLTIISLGFVKTNAQWMCATVPGSIRYTPSKALETSDVVFTGEIIEVQKGSSADVEKVTFKVKSAWKKEVGETFTLTTYRVSCGFFGEVGEKYLIYVYKRKETFNTNGCTRTRFLGDADKDLKELKEKGEKPIKIHER
jgi:hypothetical protein